MEDSHESQGGGLQFGEPASNDHSDWISQDQDFIGVSVGYRLGLLGFMAHESLPSANAGLLDQRLALRWAKKNIKAFGGNPQDITIVGQSGGGLAVVSQLLAGPVSEGDCAFHAACTYV